MSRQPYIGLRAFSREEQALFFGREQHSNELIERLNQQHFLAVVGDSGCGKSSLIKAGLIPGLQAGFLTEAGSHWCVVETRPGNAPFTNLAEALCQNNALGAEYETALKTNQFLTRSPFSLHELLAIKPLPNNAKLLIVCDQFEELFRYSKQQANSEEAAAFAALLLASANPYPLASGEMSNSVYVILTMRSDYLGNCAQFAGLAEAINQGLYLTPRLNRQQLRSAIERPALVCNGKVEPALLVKLLGEIGNDADQLPLLQHVLMRLWDKAANMVRSPSIADDAHPIVVKLADYEDEKIQTLKNALSTHADETFNELSDSQKLIAKQVFCRLTGAESGKADTRNPTKVSELLALTGQNLAELAVVLKPFRQAGRCFLLPQLDVELKPDTVLDITHESLIRNWARLEQWTKEEAENAKTYQRLEDRALEWQKHKADFLQASELEIFQQWWQEKQPTELWAKRYGESFKLAEKFLNASQAANQQRQQSENKRRNFLMIGLIIFSVIVSGLAGFSFWQYQKAKQQTRFAFQAKQQAEQQTKLALDSIKNLTYDLMGDLKELKGSLPAIEKIIYSNIVLLEKIGTSEAIREKSVNYNLLADVYLRSDKHKALEWSEKGLKNFKQLAKQDLQSRVAQRDLSISLNKVADIYLRLGNKRQALDLYKENLNIFKRLAEQDSENLAIQWDLSDSFNKLANIYLQLGDAKNALNYYQQAVKISQTLLEQDWNDVKAKQNLSVSFDGLTDVYLRLGDIKTARDYNEKYSNISQALTTKAEQNTQAQQRLQANFERPEIDPYLKFVKEQSSLNYYQPNYSKNIKDQSIGEILMTLLWTFVLFSIPLIIPCLLIYYLADTYMEDLNLILLEVMMSILVIGIALSQAIPIYQNDMKKAKNTKSLAEISGLKIDASVYYSENGTWPLPSNANSSDYASGFDGIIIIRRKDQNQQLSITPLIRGDQDGVESDSILWLCGYAKAPSAYSTTAIVSSTTIPASQLPSACVY